MRFKSQNNIDVVLGEIRRLRAKGEDLGPLFLELANALYTLAETAGLSPRMRGNRIHRSRPFARPGSIPAHAGKPAQGGQTENLARVYPRACGETRTPRRAICSPRGLSPRMRGNLAGGSVGEPLIGSIPAHAGKPATLRF